MSLSSIAAVHVQSRRKLTTLTLLKFTFAAAVVCMLCLRVAHERQRNHRARAMFRAAERGERLPIAKLDPQRVNVDLFSAQGRTLALWAYVNEDLAAARYLTQVGSPLKSKSGNHTALLQAVAHLNPRLLSLALASGQFDRSDVEKALRKFENTYTTIAPSARNSEKRQAEANERRDSVGRMLEKARCKLSKNSTG